MVVSGIPQNALISIGYILVRILHREVRTDPQTDGKMEGHNHLITILSGGGVINMLIKSYVKKVARL